MLDTYNLGMDRLEEAAAPGAFHNSLQRSDPPKCHKHTREAILAKIMDWVMKIDTKAFVMWLYGPAWAGKSAIAQTIAEFSYERNLLLASFFFCRSDSSRNNSKQLISTIAYQVAVVIPGVRELMEVTIDNDPHILSRSLITQFTMLITNPLERLLGPRVGEQPALPNLILIDGLEDCMDGTQVQVLEVIFAISKCSKFPFKFLVASRSEQEISAALSNSRIREGLTRLPLETDYNDIERFLHDKFDEIRHSHPIRSDLPSSWPSSEDIKALVNKSSGQFIYASSVVKFVSSPQHLPTNRLEIILGLRPVGKDPPFAELDALFRCTFASVQDTARAVQIIATTLMLGRTPVSVNLLTHILGLTPSEIKLSLTALGPLVAIYELPNNQVEILHATVGDFLFDEARSQELYVDRRSIHTKLTQAFLNMGWSIPSNNSNANASLVSTAHRPPFDHNSLLNNGDEQPLHNTLNYDGHSRPPLATAHSPYSQPQLQDVTHALGSIATQTEIKGRKQPANFACTVPGCNSTFTRGFNLKGHLRSHYEQKPYKCLWPGCGKGFAREHDCKRHEQLHSNFRLFECEGCKKQFARMDTLNRHLRSEAGAECAMVVDQLEGLYGDQLGARNVQMSPTAAQALAESEDWTSIAV